MKTIPVDEWPNSPARRAKRISETRRRELELESQIVVIQWADLQSLPCGKYPELRWLFHVPNGGRRGKAEAGKLKASGVRAGVPDLFLPVPRGGFCGLWIEMKANDEDVRKEQQLWHDWLRSQQYAVATCWDANQAIQTLEEYLECRLPG